jgi:hypothetical protein
LYAETLRAEVLKQAPKPVKKMTTAAQVARFKREQREFDRIVIELEVVTPSEVEARNSLVNPNAPIRIIDFARSHSR